MNEAVATSYAPQKNAGNRIIEEPLYVPRKRMEASEKGSEAIVLYGGPDVGCDEAEGSSFAPLPCVGLTKAPVRGGRQGSVSLSNVYPGLAEFPS